MIVQFGTDQIECRALFTQAGRLKHNDIVQFGETLLRVETVQKECLGWEGTRNYFQSIIFRTPDNELIQTRRLEGTQKVYRPRQTKW